MDELTLQYQGAGPGLYSPGRRNAARHLRLWAFLLLVFAALLGWVLLERMVFERRTSYVTVAEHPLLGRVMRLKVTWVYHWGRLVWVAPLLASPVVLAASYWMLALRILRRSERMFPVVALTLAVAHTLAGTLLVGWFFVEGMAALQFGKWDVTTFVALAGSLLGAAMVPGALYVSMALMDLMREQRVVQVAADGAVAGASEGLLAGIEDEEDEEDQEEEEEGGVDVPAPGSSSA